MFILSVDFKVNMAKRESLSLLAYVLFYLSHMKHYI